MDPAKGPLAVLERCPGDRTCPKGWDCFRTECTVV